MLTIESRMIIIFKTCSPISYNHIFYGYLVLEPHLVTYPLKFRCSIKASNQIRDIYLKCSTIATRNNQWTVTCWLGYISWNVNRLHICYKYHTQKTPSWVSQPWGLFWFLFLYSIHFMEGASNSEVKLQSQSYSDLADESLITQLVDSLIERLSEVNDFN